MCVCDTYARRSIDLWLCICIGPLWTYRYDMTCDVINTNMTWHYMTFHIVSTSLECLHAYSLCLFLARNTMAVFSQLICRPITMCFQRCWGANLDCSTDELPFCLAALVHWLRAQLYFAKIYLGNQTSREPIYENCWRSPPKKKKTHALVYYSILQYTILYTIISYTIYIRCLNWMIVFFLGGEGGHQRLRKTTWSVHLFWVFESARILPEACDSWIEGRPWRPQCLRTVITRLTF